MLSSWEGDTSDDYRAGRPVIGTDEQNIFMVQLAIQEDLHISIHELRKTCSFMWNH